MLLDGNFSDVRIELIHAVKHRILALFSVEFSKNYNSCFKFLKNASSVLKFNFPPNPQRERSATAHEKESFGFSYYR
jgi:hypothetical protein